MNKNKVCVMTSAHYFDDVRVFYKQCRTLARAGYNVTFVVPHDKDEYVDGINIKAIPKPGSRKERFIKTCRQIYKAAIQTNASVYHFHDPDLLPYAQLLRLRGKTVIYDMHENLPKDILTKTWIGARKRKLLSSFIGAMEHIFMSGMYVVFAETSYKKDYPWIKNYIDVLNMPDLNYLLKLDCSQKQKDFALGYVGTVGPDRGIISILNALAMVQTERSNCSFHCVGPIDEQHNKDLLTNMDKLSLNNVYFYNYLPPVQAWDIIRTCHIGMAVLKPDPNYFESYPTKLFEYMSLGIPVITSDFPLYKKVIENNDCGICVDSLNTEEIATAVKYIMDNPERARQMGDNGRRAVKEHYSWEKEAAKLLGLYKELSL